MVWVLPIIKDRVVTCRSLLVAWHLVDDYLIDNHTTYLIVILTTIGVSTNLSVTLAKPLVGC